MALHRGQRIVKVTSHIPLNYTSKEVTPYRNRSEILFVAVISGTICYLLSIYLNCNDSDAAISRCWPSEPPFTNMV